MVDSSRGGEASICTCINVYNYLNKQEIDWSLFLAFFMYKRKVIELSLSYRIYGFHIFRYYKTINTIYIFYYCKYTIFSVTLHYVNEPLRCS